MFIILAEEVYFYTVYNRMLIFWCYADNICNCMLFWRFNWWSHAHVAL